ncbi:MAG: hypothetical protein WDO68_22205 [Gammaproteobacteria bacterium]
MLLIVAFVTAYSTFRWLAEDASDFVGRASATIVAIGIAAGIWWVWHFLYGLIPRLRNTTARLGVLASVIPVTVLIVAGSANPNAAAFSGRAAQNTAIDFQIVEFERAASLRGEAAHQLAGALTDLDAIITKIESDAKAELERGAISGVAKQGAVHDLLSRLGEQLSGLRATIQKQQDEGNIVLAAAQGDLAAMRETSGKGLPAAERMKLVGKSADALRQKLNSVDTRPLAASITRLVEGMPGEVSGLSMKLSDDPKVAARQREALDRLRGEIAGTTERLVMLSAKIAASTPPETPAFRPMTGTEALQVYWRSYTSTWAIAIALDLLPFFGWLWLLIVTSTTTRAERVREEIAGMTVEQAVYSNIASALLRVSNGDPQAAKAVIADLLGREGK